MIPLVKGKGRGQCPCCLRGKNSLTVLIDEVEGECAGSSEHGPHLLKEGHMGEGGGDGG